MINVLITGSSGYIGSHLVQYLSKYWSLSLCDLKDGKDFGEIRGLKIDTVVHLAANASVTESMKDPDACLENNALKLIPFLTRNKVEKLIFTATGGAIYGDRHQAKEEDASWSGCISPYGQSKYLAEKIIRHLQPKHTILRLGNVYGGHDTDRLELAAHAHFKKDDPIVVYGGAQTRDFVHVDTVCQAILHAILSDVIGTFNIGSGKSTNLLDLARTYGASRGVPVCVEPQRAGEITHVSLDISKAVAAGFNLSPRNTILM